MEGLAVFGILLVFLFAQLLKNRYFWALISPLVNVAIIIAILYGIGVLLGSDEEEDAVEIPTQNEVCVVCNKFVND